MLADLAQDKANYATFSVSNGDVVGMDTSYTSELFETVSGALSADAGIDIGNDGVELILQLTQSVENGKISFGLSTANNKLSAFAVVESYLGSSKHIYNSASVKIKLSMDDDEVQQAELVKERIKEFAYGAVFCVAIAGVTLAAGKIIAISGAAGAVVNAINSLYGAISLWLGAVFNQA